MSTEEESTSPPPTVSTGHRPSQLRGQLINTPDLGRALGGFANAYIPVPDDDSEPPVAEPGQRSRRRVGLLVGSVLALGAIGAGSAVLVANPADAPETAALGAGPRPSGEVVPSAGHAPGDNPTTTTVKGPAKERAAEKAASADKVAAQQAAADKAVKKSASDTGDVTHEASYRDGKLYLSGRLPTKESSNAFVQKAAEVIGPDNVVDGYIIDPSAPEPGPGRVRVDEDLVFAPGSAELSPDYSQILDLGIAVMKLNPEVQMVITGHTDDIGSDALNQELSEDRSIAVAKYLTAQGGLNPSRFTAKGMGETSPRVPNDTEANQRLNRRIEVELLGLV